MGWTVLSSLGALMAISSQTRAYQMADASVLSVFEYSFLIFASFWGWVLWEQALDIWDVIGMIMIATAGSGIAGCFLHGCSGLVGQFRPFSI